jgi:hypothetical protein
LPVLHACLLTRTCLALIILWNERSQKYIVFKHRSTYAVFKLARKPSEPINRISRGITVLLSCMYCC